MRTRAYEVELLLPLLPDPALDQRFAEDAAFEQEVVVGGSSREGAKNAKNGNTSSREGAKNAKNGNTSSREGAKNAKNGEGGRWL